MKIPYDPGEGTRKSSPLKIWRRLGEKSATGKKCNDYYPFGLTFNSFTKSYSTPQNYKYNGKELHGETELYDFHARRYDPAIARWVVPDPLSELTFDWTPFRFGFNNPLLFNDPSGLTEERSTIDIINDLWAEAGDNGSATWTNPDPCPNGEECNENEDKKKEGEACPTCEQQAQEQNNLPSNFSSGLSLMTGTSEALMEGVITTLPVYDVSGRLVGHVKVITKGALPAGLKVLKLGGNAINIGGVVYDLHLLNEDKISVGEFAYNATGTATSATVTYLIGGSAGAGAGVLVGGLFMLGKASYEGIQDLNDHHDWVKQNTSHRNRSYSWKDFESDFIYWMSGEGLKYWH